MASDSLARAPHLLGSSTFRSRGDLTGMYVRRGSEGQGIASARHVRYTC